MLMNLDIIDNNIDEFTQSFTIRFICLDVVYDNKYIYEIFNDVNLVINDVFNNLKLSEINIYIENEELILNKIQDKYVDSVAGFYFDLTFNLEKTNLCIEKNVQLIHIWEDDWIHKKDIVKSMILNKLCKTTNKIYARKTEMKEITDNKLIKDFLEKNHIQGFIISKINIGLFYNDELVSLMTFGNKRIVTNDTNHTNEWELSRFCNKLNTKVIGGASKLFKYFIDNYQPTEIISYANRSHSNGGLYEKLNFIYSHTTNPNYYYIVDKIRKHRFTYKKNKLVKDGFDSKKTEHEIMLERKIYRIYDSGQLKFVWKSNK
jgi:hypothetical protein